MSWAAAALWLSILWASGGAPVVAIFLACLAGYLVGKRVGARDA